MLARWRTISKEGDVGEHVQDVYGGQGSCCVDLEGPNRVLWQRCQLIYPASLIPSVGSQTYFDLVNHIEGVVVSAIRENDTIQCDSETVCRSIRAT